MSVPASKMTWDTTADQQLLLSILAEHAIQVDYAAVAARLGAHCTARAVQERLKKLKKLATEQSAGGLPTAPTPIKLEKNKERAKAKATNANATAAKATKGRTIARVGKVTQKSQATNTRAAKRKAKTDEIDDQEVQAGTKRKRDNLDNDSNETDGWSVKSGIEDALKAEEDDLTMAQVDGGIRFQ